MNQIGVLFNNQCYSVDEVKGALYRIGVDASQCNSFDMTDHGLSITELYLAFETEEMMDQFVTIFFDHYFESVGEGDVDFSALVLRTDNMRISVRIACLTANSVAMLVRDHDAEMAELNNRLTAVESCIQRSGMASIRSLLEETIRVLGEAEIIDADDTLMRLLPVTH